MNSGHNLMTLNVNNSGITISYNITKAELRADRCHSLAESAHVPALEAAGQTFAKAGKVGAQQF